MRRCKAQQLRKLVLVGRILDQSFLDDWPELTPEILIIVAIARRYFRKHIEYTSCQCATDRLQVRMLLQEFTRHVEWQIGRVYDALDEAQVERQELLGIIHNENALHVQFQTAWRVPIPQIEWRIGRDVEKTRVLTLALNTIVTPAQRVREIV